MTLSRRGYRAICIVAVALILLLGASRLWLVTAPFSTDANEGWNAYQALRAIGAAGAGPLYPSPGQLTGNNYPPLSFYLIGALTKVGADPIIAGRIVAGFAVLVVSAEIRAIVLRLTGCTKAATLAGLFFLGFTVTLFRSYLLLDDPQWLAHAVMTGALLLLIPAKPDGEPANGAVIAAALLMIVGGLIKHNLFAVPIAVTAWLASNHRRALLCWIVAGAAGLLLAGLLLYAAYGEAFIPAIFDADRRQSFARLTVKSLPVVAAFLPGLILTARLMRARWDDPRLDLLLFSVPVGLVLGVLLRSGLGVDRNAHFETLVMLSIAVGTVLGRQDTAVARALTALPFVGLVPLGLSLEWKEVRNRAAIEAGWNAITDRVRSMPGPVACEVPALCFRAGKPFEIDFFLYGERIAAGRSDAALRAALDMRRFAAIVREGPPSPAKKEPPNPIWDMVGQRYVTAFTGPDGRSLLVPKP